jgi:hypothetical protein
MPPNENMVHKNGNKKAYSIQFPSTTKDDGSPSEDALHDCRRVLLLVEDERHLTAQKLYSSVILRLENHPGRNPEELRARRRGVFKRRHMKKHTAFQEEEYLALLQFIEGHRPTLATLEVREILDHHKKMTEQTSWNQYSNTIYF